MGEMLYDIASSFGKAAQQSQDNLNAQAQSSHVEHSSPGESAPAKPIAHDDAVDHALMTDPATGGPHKDFPNSVSSILDKLRGGAAPGSTPDGGGSAGANDLVTPPSGGGGGGMGGVMS
jgi:hypothetical protein